MPKTKTKSKTTIFTRGEFELIASLLEDEQTQPRSAINPVYRAQVLSLLERVSWVAHPDGSTPSTDAVEVVS